MKKRIALAEAMRRVLAIIVTYALMWSLVPAPAVAQMQDEAGANEEQAEQVPPDQNSPQEMQSAEEGVSADEDEQRLAELAHKLATRVRSEVSKETEENAEGLPRKDALAARYVRILHVMLARVLSLETEGQAATADEQAVTADAQDQELRAAVKDSGTSARLVAKALAELGVEAVVVGRQPDGARWVMVRIDGEWYHADAWADAQRVIAKRHEQQPMQQAEDEPSVPADPPLVRHDAVHRRRAVARARPRS